MHTAKDELQLLAELEAFARRALPRCPPDIDPHHFGSKLSACQYLDIAREAAAISADGEILDWGTGFGHVAFLLARLGCKVEAYDIDTRFHRIDPGFLESPGVHFAQRPFEEPLPYEDGRFATALSVGTLEHVTDENWGLSELHRVLRTGGRLLVYHLPNRWSYIERLARRAGRFSHERTYTRRSARALLARHGFLVERLVPYHVLPRSSFSRIGALRALSDRRYRAIETLDSRLSRLFPLSLFCTAFTVQARRR